MKLYPNWSLDELLATLDFLTQQSPSEEEQQRLFAIREIVVEYLSE